MQQNIYPYFLQSAVYLLWNPFPAACLFGEHYANEDPSII